MAVVLNERTDSAQALPQAWNASPLGERARKKRYASVSAQPS